MSKYMFIYLVLLLTSKQLHLADALIQRNLQKSSPGSKNTTQLKLYQREIITARKHKVIFPNKKKRYTFNYLSKRQTCSLCLKTASELLSQGNFLSLHTFQYRKIPDAYFPCTSRNSGSSWTVLEHGAEQGLISAFSWVGAGTFLFCRPAAVF